MYLEINFPQQYIRIQITITMKNNINDFPFNFHSYLSDTHMKYLWPHMLGMSTKLEKM